MDLDPDEGPRPLPNTNALIWKHRVQAWLVRKILGNTAIIANITIHGEFGLYRKDFDQPCIIAHNLFISGRTSPPMDQLCVGRTPFHTQKRGYLFNE